MDIKDVIEVDVMANTVARSLSKEIKNSKLPVTECLIAVITGVSKVIQATAILSHTDPKELGKIAADGINLFFEIGGDPSIEDIIKHRINKGTN